MCEMMVCDFVCAPLGALEEGVCSGHFNFPPHTPPLPSPSPHQVLLAGVPAGLQDSSSAAGGQHPLLLVFERCLLLLKVWGGGG